MSAAACASAPADSPSKPEPANESTLPKSTPADPSSGVAPQQAKAEAERLREELEASTDPAVWRANTEQLAGLGGAGYAALLTVWEHCPDFEARRIAWRCLSRAGALPLDHPARDPLGQFEYADPLQQEVWLHEAPPRPFRDLTRLIEDLRDRNPLVRVGGARTLADRSTLSPAATDRLVAYFRAHTLDNVEGTVTELAGIGSLGKRIIDYLANRSRFSGSEIRRLEVIALFARNLPDDQLIDEVRRLMWDDQNRYAEYVPLIRQLVDERGLIASAAASTRKWTASAAWHLLHYLDRPATDEELLLFLQADSRTAANALGVLVRRMQEQPELVPRVAAIVTPTHPLYERYIEHLAHAGSDNILAVPPDARGAALDRIERMSGHWARGARKVLTAMLELADATTDAERLAAAEALAHATRFRDVRRAAMARGYYLQPVLTLLQRPDTVDPAGGPSVHEVLLRLLVDLDYWLGSDEEDKYAAEEAVLRGLIAGVQPSAADELVACLARFAPAALDDHREWLLALWSGQPSREMEAALCQAVAALDGKPLDDFRALAWTAYERLLPDATSDDLAALHKALDAVGVDADIAEEQLRQLEDPATRERLDRASRLLRGNVDLTVKQAVLVLTVMLDPAEWYRYADESFSRSADSYDSAQHRDPGDPDARRLVSQMLAPLFRILFLYFAQRSTTEASERITGSRLDALLIVAGRREFTGFRASTLAMQVLGDNALAAAFEHVARPTERTAAGGGRVLARIGPRAWRQGPALVELFRTHRHTADADWCAAVLEALGSLGAHGGDAVPLLIDAASDGEANHAVRAAAVQALGSIVADDDSRDADVMPVLVRAAGSDGALTRAAAAHQLAALGTRAPASAAAALARIVRTDDEPAQRDATRALWSHGNPAAALLAELANADASDALPVLRALAGGDPGDAASPADAVRLIRPWLDVPDTRILAAAALCLHGPADDPAVTEAATVVIETLRANPPAIGPAPLDPSDWVAIMSGDRDAVERECEASHLIRALRRRGHAAGAAGGIEVLVAFVQDASRTPTLLDVDSFDPVRMVRMQSVGTAACRAIRHLGSPELVIPVLVQLGSSDAATQLLQVEGGWRALQRRVRAGEYLTALRDAGPAAAPLLPALLERWTKTLDEHPPKGLGSVWRAEELVEAIVAVAPPDVSWPIVEQAMAQKELTTRLLDQLPAFATHAPARTAVFHRLCEAARIPTKPGFFDQRPPRIQLDLLRSVAAYGSADRNLASDAARTLVEAAAAATLDDADRVLLCRLLGRLQPVAESVAWMNDVLASSNPDELGAALTAITAWYRHHPQADLPPATRNTATALASDPSPRLRALAAVLLRLLD